MSTNPDSNERRDYRQYQEEVIDLRQYLIIINKWRGVIVLLTLAAILTSAVLSFFVLSPVYETKTVVMVAQAVSAQDARGGTARPNQDNLESVVNSISAIPIMTINTYVAQVKTNSVMEQAAKALVAQGQELTTGQVAAMTEVVALKDTNLIEIKASSTDPEQAALVANTVRQEYLAFISANNSRQMERSINFLQNQKSLEEKNLETASQELQQLEAEPRNLTFLQKDLEAKYADLSKYQSLANQARIEYEQARAGRDRLRSQIEDSTLSTSGYASLEDSLIRKETELAEKEAQLAAVQGVVGSLGGDLRILQAEMAEKKLAMDRLTATVEQAKKTYTLLAEKSTQTEIVQSVNLGETYLLPVSSAPIPGTPVKPNKMLNITIAALLGLMGSVLLAFLLEYLDNTIKDADDIQRLFNLPVVGTIPMIEPGRNESKKKKPVTGKEVPEWNRVVT